MKYYINLLKNKNYKAIICSIAIFLLGCICVFFNLKNVIEEGIQNNGLSVTIGIGGIDAISRSNLGMVIVGLINIYTGLILAPRTYNGSQNDEDYEIKSVDDCIYIKYKNREFLLNKETFGVTKLFFRDKNGKFVSMTTGYQIYNYVMYKHKEKTEKEITNGLVIGIEDIITKFSNIRLMNEEEKRWYIDYKKLKYRRRIISFIFSVVFYAVAAFFSFGAFSSILLNRIDKLLQIITVGMVFFALAMLCNKISKRQMTLIDKITKGKSYIADCYSYDKKISDHSRGTDYLIKVTDKKGHFLNKWFSIHPQIYKNSDIIKARLVIIGEDEKNIDIVTE